MNLNPALYLFCSDAAASQAGEAMRCKAANFRWERAVSAARAEEYNVYVGEVATYEDWQAEHKGYLSEFVHVAKDLPRSSECFMALNGQAHLHEGMDDTFLLRLESLDELLNQPLLSDDVAQRFWLRFFNSQKDLRKDTLPDSDEALRAQFLDQWNK